MVSIMKKWYLYNLRELVEYRFTTYIEMNELKIAHRNTLNRIQKEGATEPRKKTLDKLASFFKMEYARDDEGIIYFYEEEKPPPEDRSEEDSTDPSYISETDSQFLEDFSKYYLGLEGESCKEPIRHFYNFLINQIKERENGKIPNGQRA